jgi:hypothetical protein
MNEQPSSNKLSNQKSSVDGGLVGTGVHQFDAIRPFEPEELPMVYDRLLADPQFQQILKFIFPDVPLAALKQKLYGCKTLLDFQLAFVKSILEKILAKASKGYDMDSTQLDKQANYTFVSNHRDIVLDSAILDLLLVDNKFSTTCEIAIGDNLLKYPWIKDVVRLNKSFIVERDLPMRQLLLASKRLSEYMHYAIAVKHDNIWIAQREGRAKDSNDRTQKSILQMMAMGGEGSVIDRLKSLHIVPLAISYEFDPCDFLKAKEFQQRRDTEDFHKGPMDDVTSMKTGIFGYKGFVHYHCAPCIDDYLSTLDPKAPKGVLFETIAQHIDSEIHRNYRLYPNNYIALDELRGTDHSDKYTTADKQTFDKYLAGQLQKIDLPNKDEAFLHERMLTMYANPAINFAKANGLPE